MIHRHRLLRLLFLTFLLTTLTAAWPWPPTFENEGSLVRRQEKSDKDAAASDRTSSSPKKTAAVTSEEAPAATSKTDSKAEASGSKAASSSAGKKAASSKANEEPTKTPDVDDSSPAGVVAMITPAPRAADEYYKIGNKVSFVWSYSTLQIPPKAIDVLVSCTFNQATYTIASNMTYEPTATVVWDTGKQVEGQTNLINENYKLIIHDAAEDLTAVPQPGELAIFNSLTFGMYKRKEYVPRNEWICATCSGALSNMERQTLKFVLGMCTITVLSFTWFAGGFMGF